jgi:hypothetical protein
MSGVPSIQLAGSTPTSGLANLTNLTALTSGAWVSATQYPKGSSVFSLSAPTDLYIARQDIVSSTTDPASDATNWVKLATTNTGVVSIDGQTGVLTTKVGQYYLTSLQSLSSGNTDIIFTTSQPWSDNTAITWTGPSALFTVAVKGLYQLEFAVSVDANGATWTIGTNKGASIDITRPPSAELIILPTNALMASGVNYGQVATATYALEIGDVINCRVANTFSTATPFAIPQSGFDLSTFFTWTLIKPLP